jgi:hypothetical protein
MKKREDGEKTEFRLRVEAIQPPPASRQRSVQHPAPGSFGEQFTELFASVGLSQAAYAEILSNRLGRPVSQAVLSGWLRGRSPRRVNHSHRPEDEVLAAARNILEEQGRELARVKAEVVQQTINAWVAQGLTLKQIRIAGEIPQTVLREWAEGLVTVARPRFEAFCQRVELFVELITEVQMAWRVEQQVLVRIAQARKLVGKNGIVTLEQAYERLRAAELIAEASNPGPT